MRWLVWGIVASLSGCSFAFVSGPPPHHEELPAFDCTESRVAPVLDTVFAALAVANLAVAASSTGPAVVDAFNGNPPINRGTAVPLYIALAAVGTSSAYYGSSKTSDCREALEAARNRAQGSVGPQAPLPPSAGRAGSAARHRRFPRRSCSRPAPPFPRRSCSRPAPPFPRRLCSRPAPPFPRRLCSRRPVTPPTPSPAAPPPPPPAAPSA